LETRLTASVFTVGGGPCGIMPATGLGRRVVSAVIDEKPGTAFNPQANTTRARSMEHYRRLGLADEVRQAGLPANYPGDESALIHRRQRAADRALVEADDVADARSRNVSRVLACRGELQIARLSVPAHGLPSLSVRFDIETPRTALEEQAAGGPQ
jgi:hypothetical protein